ncbi:MAG TPA: HAMP domain-containing sensor histidine kinase [Mycobacteriales bacterium]|nr:HAMP domain-containing sensor histidine kinase [Mycobacteriales bacterium]
MRRLGLRARITATFALGALALSAALSMASYQVVRQNLLDDRERSLVRSAYFDAAVVREGLRAENAQTREVLRNLDTGELRRPVIRRDGEWFLRSADTGITDAIPTSLQQLAQSGEPGTQVSTLAGEPAYVVAVPLLAERAVYYEVTALGDLRRTLTVLATVLGVAALGTTLAGAALGAYASRRALGPLTAVASAADGIASGDLGARVTRDTDPDLDRLAVAFNRMVDAVQGRADADRRFAADVSHELRSPLQTLSAATSVLVRRKDGMDDRTASAVELLDEEVRRFEQLVADLLELARADLPADRRPTDVVALVQRAAAVHGLPPEAVEASGDGSQAHVDPRRFEQLLANLLGNAEKHGGGAVRVAVRTQRRAVHLEVDDEGPGVPPDERSVVFERFARGRAANARGGSEGTGLGLALVAQHVTAHRGWVRIEDRPGGGARFVVDLPAGEAA